MDTCIVTRWWAYWKGNIEQARGWFDIVLMVFCWITYAVAELFGDQIPFDTLEDWLKGITLPVAILATLHCFLWLPFSRHEALSAKLRQKLTVRTGSIQDGTNWHHPEQNPPLVNLRLAVTNEGIEQVEDCKALLIRVDRNSFPSLKGINFSLPFAPSEKPGSESKTIRHDVTEYVDVIAVRQGGTVFMQREWSSFFPTLEETFCRGDTILTISLTGRSTPTVTRRFLLHVAEKYEESSLTPI